MKKVLRLLLPVLILAVIAILAVWGYKKYAGPGEQLVFRTEKIARGDLMRTITATGTVEPEELINVGAQVQGMITKFGPDTENKSMDYGSRVKAGGVLAWIDDSLYAAELKSAKAAQAQAKAGIESAKANIQQSEAKLELAELNYQRAKQLRPSNAIAQNTYDTTVADYHVAQSNVAVAKASLGQAQAQLESANASYERALRNLSYCVIKSPVDGVIIDRRVNIGQTVVSSMNAPSLFLIAKDLKRMQVWVSVNEADIGQIKVGQDVLFTVDAFQNREFKGKVRKIRLNATMSSNVVTYVTEIETDNSDGTLLPYLTANVRFILAKRNQVLTVPNAAFRFMPDPAMVPAEFHKNLEVKFKRGERQIWIRDGKVMRPVTVKTGLTDGSVTEIKAEGLTDGMTVVTGFEFLTPEKRALRQNNDSRSPFLPQMPKRNRRRK